MVKVRLSRLGSRGKVFYRIVAIDEQKKRTGKFLEILGYWHPSTSRKEINKNRLKYWAEKGAVISKAVEKLSK